VNFISIIWRYVLGEWDANSAVFGKPEGRIPFGRPRRRRDDNIKTDLQEIRWEKWAGLIWLKTEKLQTLVNAAMEVRFPQNAGYFLGR
jgi:hypothetical protein